MIKTPVNLLESSFISYRKETLRTRIININSFEVMTLFKKINICFQELDLFFYLSKYCNEC